MTKRFFLVFILVFILTGSVFSAEQFKHQRGDMYAGVNLGMGFTPNLFNAISVKDFFPWGNYALTFEAGLSYDYYQTEWLSFGAGLTAHFGMYAFLYQNLPVSPNTGFFDIASMPLSLTIPLSAHINIPYVSFLYAGIGVSLNIPLVSLLNGDDPDGIRQPEMKDVFLGMPIDIGFDLMPEDGGGMRFFFRITPEIHVNERRAVPIGFVWQVYNLKIR